MDNIKNDFYYIKRLIRNIEVTSRYLSDKSMDDILVDGYLQDAIENRFTKIAEDVTKLSKEYKESTPSIPWTAIVSIRNRICHDYDVVDSPVLYKTVKVNFPQVRNELLKTIKACRMNLYPSPFELVKLNLKTIEMRLYDEKRKQLNVGDIIVFSQSETKEEIIAEIKDIKVFKSFEELYASYPKSKLGYMPNEVANPKDMENIYSKENTIKYGVIAIEIVLY